MLRQKFLQWLAGLFVSPAAKPPPRRKRLRGRVSWARLTIQHPTTEEPPGFVPHEANPLVPLHGGEVNG